MIIYAFLSIFSTAFSPSQLKAQISQRMVLRKGKDEVVVAGGGLSQNVRVKPNAGDDEANSQNKGNCERNPFHTL